MAPLIDVPDEEGLPTTLSPSLLLLVLDIHPLSWSILAEGESPLPVDQFVNTLMVFLNAHLCTRWGNDIVIYGASAGRSKLLYPLQGGPELGPSANMYHPFKLLDKRFESGLKAMVQEEQERFEDEDEAGRLNEQPAIVSALTKALCYIHRITPQNVPATDDASAATAPDRLAPRIMVINATPSSTSINENATADAIAKPPAKGGGEMRGGYVGLMNCVFAAQKAKVPIDVLTLPPPSGGTGAPIFLQQAAYLTEGVYWRWNGKGGLLQYLHGIYLPPPALRQKPFAVPPQDAVDFRAVCFCHQDVVDVGFVCSVCLSIFCKPLPVCQMCKTKFPHKILPTLKAHAADITPIPVPQTIVQSKK